MTAVLPTPRRALIELDERRARLQSRATGRVLDVAEHGPWRLAELAAGEERYDVVLSMLQISAAADAPAMCRTLAALLADDGELWFLEPTSVTGTIGSIQHALGPWVRRTTGRRPDHDVPRLIRDAGLTVVDCERFVVRALWPYRSFVQGVARRPLTGAVS
jgi:hypothetical protein